MAEAPAASVECEATVRMELALRQADPDDKASANIALALRPEVSIYMTAKNTLIFLSLLFLYSVTCRQTKC